MRLLLFRGLFKSFINSTGYIVSDDGTISTLEGHINPHIGTCTHNATYLPDYMESHLKISYL